MNWVEKTHKYTDLGGTLGKGRDLWTEDEDRGVKNKPDKVSILEKKGEIAKHLRK